MARFLSGDGVSQPDQHKPTGPAKEGVEGAAPDQVAAPALGGGHEQNLQAL
ncbi:hypothetical protein [Pseudomonas sp. NBRC 111125]|uniref:hypothetical protein n=1 Tax=Pseudomonas sp. NBRC 111125 TaxID=1661040 RepID=UPI001C445E01|nr:hypothetical protein [Pseudomonas sp. NBRC 111125]